MGGALPSVRGLDRAVFGALRSVVRIRQFRRPGSQPSSLSAAISSDSSRRPAAATLSSRWSTEPVPGIVSIVSDRASSHAKAIWWSVASWCSVMSVSAEDWSRFWMGPRQEHHLLLLAQIDQRV